MDPKCKTGPLDDIYTEEQKNDLFSLTLKA